MIFILRHLTHLKTKECDKCDRKFGTNSLLQCHKRIKHQKRNFIHCTYPNCTAKYKIQGQMGAHIKSTHLGIRRHVRKPRKLQESTKVAPKRTMKYKLLLRTKVVCKYCGKDYQRDTLKVKDRQF